MLKPAPQWVVLSWKENLELDAKLEELWVTGSVPSISGPQFSN